MAQVPHYFNLPRLRNDCMVLFANVKTLKPNVGCFVGQNGQQVQLFYVVGTIAITFKGTTTSDNIPYLNRSHLMCRPFDAS